MWWQITMGLLAYDALNKKPNPKAYKRLSTVDKVAHNIFWGGLTLFAFAWVGLAIYGLMDWTYWIEKFKGVR